MSSSDDDDSLALESSRRGFTYIGSMFSCFFFSFCFYFGRRCDRCFFTFEALGVDSPGSLGKSALYLIIGFSRLRSLGIGESLASGGVCSSSISGCNFGDALELAIFGF